MSATIKALLASAQETLRSVESPRAEAQILLAHVLHKLRSFLLAWPDAEVTAEQAARFGALVSRRAQGEPVAYLLGRREFFGLDLHVVPGVLIPRPETELLVEAALARLPQGACDVLDLGTGSGAIALALATQRPELRVVAVDASAQALAVAEENARRLGVDVVFRHADWCSALHRERFAMIVSNPPYIREDDVHLAQGDLRFEPRMALASGRDGLDAIRTILACAAKHLLPGGWLLLEHGFDQADAVAELMRTHGLVQVTTLYDLQGHGRVTLGRRSME